MKKLRFFGIVLSLALIGGCVALGGVVGFEIVNNPEMRMLLKVFAYLVVALALIGAVCVFLMGVILVIGKGLGLSQGDTKAALQAAIALARSSNTINKLYGRLPRGLLPPGQAPPNYYQWPVSTMGDGPIDGHATHANTERANAEAWER